MVSRADFRNGGKNWSTTYALEGAPFEVQEQRFFTKEENDTFADGIRFVGGKEIIKSYYNPSMRSWHRYHNNNDVQALNRQALNRMWPDRDDP